MKLGKDTLEELVIIDFQYIYYMYKFQVESGRVKLSDGLGRDTGKIYLPLREVTRLVKKGNVKSIICFDSKSDRKEEFADYKANREKTLDNSDYDNIGIIRQLLENAGHSVAKENGLEADDLVYSAVMDNKDRYKINVYTVDTDMLQLVDKNVDVCIYRQRKGYVKVTEDNFESVCLSNGLFKAYVPYNLTNLYKCTVGDTSDNIKGIKGFGVAAFKKMIDEHGSYINIEDGADYDKVKDVINNIFTGDKKDQALIALDMIRLRYTDIKVKPKKANDEKMRHDSFGVYKFNSLV